MSHHGTYAQARFVAKRALAEKIKLKMKIIMDMLMRNKLAVSALCAAHKYKYKITNVCEAANSQGEIDALIKWQHSLAGLIVSVSQEQSLN
jgi:hypothetical protein